jgi:protein tyrosine phosphatase (PTP) superfamily phosphohydrolase (DUF442 family)
MAELVDIRVKANTPMSTGVRDALVMRVATHKHFAMAVVDTRPEEEEEEEAEAAEAAERRPPALVVMVYWPVIAITTNVITASIV